MCGIALVCGQRADPATFRSMLGALAPRGEVTETASADGLLAGVRRLRITDPEHAAQPLASADGRWVLCYNGEVFNYRELRAELSACGRAFRTDSDTEVVLESFLHWGVGAVRRFRGEFAFAIADTRAGRVYLARDPLGVKPLYYARAGGRLHIASEVKALVPAGAPVTEVPPGHHGWMGAPAAIASFCTGIFPAPVPAWGPSPIPRSRRAWSAPPWRTASGSGLTPD